jgi:RNA polymerase sigma-70 factor (ECF subfamily)
MVEGEDESRCVERATRGDAAAVEALLARHLPGLRTFLERRAGAVLLRKESGEDLAQSVCREVLGSLRSGRLEYQGEAAFRNWLHQAALLKMRERREFLGAAKRDADEVPASGIESQVPGGGPTPSQEAIAREQAEELSQALARLPSELRRVIELARIQGWSHAEIAAELGISEVNSRKLLSRALARLTSLRGGAPGST